MMHGTSEIWMLLKIRGRRVNLLLLARGRSIRLLLYKDFRDSAIAIKVKVKAKGDHLQVEDISGLTTRQGRGHVTIAINLETSGGIVLRGRNPRVMGHLSPSHQWDVHQCSLFRLTPPWARRDSINRRVLHRALLLCSHGRWASAWVEVEAGAQKLGLQGSKGVSMPLHRRLRL